MAEMITTTIGTLPVAETKIMAITILIFITDFHSIFIFSQYHGSSSALFIKFRLIID